VPSQLQWQAADGTLLTLTDPAAGYRVLADVTAGLTAPSYEITADRYAGIDGDTEQAVSATAREVMLGQIIEAADEATLAARVRALVRAMRPKAGPGLLIASSPDGVRRTLTCRYAGGLEGAEGRASTVPGRWVKAAIKLRAADPWWYGDQQTVSVGLGVGANFFPIFPLVLAPSTVQGEFEIDLSDADDPTYPVWTITGPGSNLVLTNTYDDYTTGEAVEVTRTIEVTASLSAGQSMIIDTRPGYQSVRRDDGTNLMGSVTTDPALWGLIEGVNTVTAALTGATTASRITGTFRPRYSGV
jgi:hypothetical protein